MYLYSVCVGWGGGGGLLKNQRTLGMMEAKRGKHGDNKLTKNISCRS